MRSSLSSSFYSRGVRRLLLAVVTAFAFAALPGCNTGNGSLGLIGKPAPALALPAGSPSLASLRGRVVVLNFWASWCAPCLEEFPSLETLQKQMPSVTVLAVSFDQDPSAYENFLRKHPFALQSVLETPGRSDKAYGVTAPPETYIVDPNGIVRRKFVGAQDWSSPEIRSFLQAMR